MEEEKVEKKLVQAGRCIWDTWKRHQRNKMGESNVREAKSERWEPPSKIAERLPIQRK